MILASHPSTKCTCPSRSLYTGPQPDGRHPIPSGPAQCHLMRNAGLSPSLSDPKRRFLPICPLEDGQRMSLSVEYPFLQVDWIMIYERKVKVLEPRSGSRQLWSSGNGGRSYVSARKKLRIKGANRVSKKFTQPDGAHVPRHLILLGNFSIPRDLDGSVATLGLRVFLDRLEDPPSILSPSIFPRRPP